MRNEILLILSLIGIFGSVLLWYVWFGEKGLYAWTVFATLTANIEVMILVHAFGMDQTLGNVLFASTFLTTDILSEVAGKKQANTAVKIGILTSLSFILLAQSWLLYLPAEADWVSSSMRVVFSNTPRMMIVSLVVYGITQLFDVWVYHKWWAFTEKRTKNKNRFLWLRNNVSTLLSQLLNTILFNFGAFIGLYDTKTLFSIIASSYVIFIFTSLADTPILYLARAFHQRKEKSLAQE